VYASVIGVHLTCSKRESVVEALSLDCEASAAEGNCMQTHGPKDLAYQIGVLEIQKTSNANITTTFRCKTIK
jgi:hypothetical protein